MKVKPADPVYLSDVVGSGTVIGAGLGEGPDGIVLVVWDGTDLFTAWETVDGTTWQFVEEGRGEYPATLAQAAMVAQAFLIHMARLRSTDAVPIRLPVGALTVITATQCEVGC